MIVPVKAAFGIAALQVMAEGKCHGYGGFQRTIGSPEDIKKCLPDMNQPCQHVLVYLLAGGTHFSSLSGLHPGFGLLGQDGAGGFRTGEGQADFPQTAEFLLVAGIDAAGSAQGIFAQMKVHAT